MKRKIVNSARRYGKSFETFKNLIRKIENGSNIVFYADKYVVISKETYNELLRKSVVNNPTF